MTTDREDKIRRIVDELDVQVAGVEANIVTVSLTPRWRAGPEILAGPPASGPGPTGRLAEPGVLTFPSTIFSPYCREVLPISVCWAMSIGVIGRRGGEVPRPGADGLRLPVRPADRARRARQCPVSRSEPSRNQSRVAGAVRERRGARPPHGPLCVPAAH